MIKYKSDFGIKFTNEEDYKNAIKSFELMDTIRRNLFICENKHREYEDKIFTTFKGEFWNKEIYDSLEKEARNDISRTIGLKTEMYTSIKLYKSLLGMGLESQRRNHND